MTAPARRQLRASVLLLFLFGLLLPALHAQTEPGFALHTTHTWAPGETPVVLTTFRNVSHLDFRIYKVKDPVKFFEQLKNPHQFGGPPPKIPQTPTLLERWHEWKQRWHRDLRSFVRDQFSLATRREYTQRRERKQVAKRLPLDVSRFAQAPLLNRDQLVLSWREMLPRTRDWESRKIPVEVHERGLYVVEAVSGGLRAYTIVLITNLALVTKAAPGQIVVFAAQRETGQPVAHAEMLVYADRHLLKRGTADPNGLDEVALTGHKPSDLVVLSRSADDFAATDIASWFLNLAQSESWRGYLYTDRPVYRPGQTVDFKGIMRAQQGHTYRVPAGQRVTVEFIDAEQKTFLSRTYTLDAFGTFSGSLQLGQGVPLGQYRMSAHVTGVPPEGRGPATGTFSVEEYKRPEYSVTVQPAQPRLLQGASNQIDVQAAYYYGAPVAGALVKWAVYRTGYWSPYRWNLDDLFDAGEEAPDDSYTGSQVGQGQGRLDANGHLRITVPTSIDGAKGDSRYTIEARVIDQANRQISGRGSFIATYASFLAVVQAERSMYQPGETAHFRVRSVDYDGKPVAAQFQVVVQKWSLREDKYVPLDHSSTQTDSNGEGSWDYPVTGQDSEEIVITAHDANGREVVGQTSIWINSESTEAGGMGSVRLVPDRKSYAPGDTANVLVLLPHPVRKSGAAADTAPTWMLITREGKQVQSRQVIAVTGASTTLHVPITAADTPNTFLNVAYLKDGQLYTGEANLRVPPVQQKLTVTLTTGRTEYQPQQTGTVTIRVSDAQGHPVKAEVSLGVVDESVYAIRPESAPDLLKFFYRTDYNRVATSLSTSYSFSGWAGRAALKLAALHHAYELADFKKGKALVQPQVRKQFQETAFWQADVLTGNDGTARVQIHFPDSLTSWRLTARAVAGNRMGSAVAHVITHKNLVLQMALPRFAVQRDRFTAYTIAHNDLKQPIQVTQTMTAQGLAIANPQPQPATVAAGGQQRAAWTFDAQQPGTATVLGKALTDSESDAVQMSFPVLPYGIRVDLPLAGDLEKQTLSNNVLHIPANSNPSGAELDLHLAPSLAGTVFASLDWLVQYPYGCTEQTVSAMLPDLVVNDTLKQLHLPQVTPQDDLDARIRTGIERLTASQNSDGGWGWWPATPSDPFMTADAVLALARAKQAGYPVPARVLSGGITSLQTFLKNYPRTVPDLRAWLTYAAVQAGWSDTNAIEAVWQNRAHLGSYGTALLALTLEAAHDQRAHAIAGSLIAQAQSNAVEAWWPEPQDPLLGAWYDTTPEVTGWALRALIDLEPGSPLIPKAVRWLTAHRDGDYWGSTKQTAVIVDTLAAYLKHSQELAPDFIAQVQVDGKTVFEKHFTRADLAEPPAEVEAPIHRGAVRLSMRKQGAGVLYWSGTAHYPSLDDHLQRMGRVKLNIVRQYYRLVPRHASAQGESMIVYHAEPLHGTAAPGDVLLVRLTVTGDNQRYLAIEDPFPAGTEPIERNDLYTLEDSPDWYRNDYDRREIHDDHVTFFQSTFERGQHEYTYLLQVILPGTFQVMPARVGPMYQPQQMATTEKTTLTIQEKQP